MGTKTRTIYIYYTRDPLQIYAHRDWVGDRKRYPMQMEIKRKLKKQFSDKIDLRLIWDKKHYIIIKGSIQEEDETIVNI